MKLLKFIGIYLAFLAQSLIFENINIAAASPDIVITAVILAALFYSIPTAAALGAFIGLVTDAVCGRLFGVYTLIYMYLAISVGAIADKRINNSPLIMAWICFLYTALYEILKYLILILLGIEQSISMLGADIVVKGIFSAVFALLFVLWRNKGIKVKQKSDSKEVAA